MQQSRTVNSHPSVYPTFSASHDRLKRRWRSGHTRLLFLHLSLYNTRFPPLNQLNEPLHLNYSAPELSPESCKSPMASPEPSVRRRKPEAKDSSASETEQPPLKRVQTLSSSESEDTKKKTSQPVKKPKSKKKKSKEEDEYDAGNIALDIARVISFLFLASCGLSYLISNGETFFWGMSNPPKYLTKAYYKELIRGPLYLTPSELSLYDGTNPDLPIYLAINWTIYDVSSNPRTYGPGGSYHYFAGCDAARAYVTGCFAEDRSPDMRGVEEMYLPLDDPAVDKHFSRAELREMKVKEREEALKKVHDGLKHWVDFFAKSDKYKKVGYVKMPKGWPGTEPRRPLCETAAKGRKVRKVPGQKEE